MNLFYRKRTEKDVIDLGKKINETLGRENVSFENMAWLIGKQDKVGSYFHIVNQKPVLYGDSLPFFTFTSNTDNKGERVLTSCRVEDTEIFLNEKYDTAKQFLELIKGYNF